MARLHVLHVMALALFACGKGTRPAGFGSGDSLENQAILTKLQGYIDCLGDHSSRVFRIADLYTGHLGGNPPSLDSDVVLQVSPDPAECLEAIAAARARPPQLVELDQAGEAYGAAVAAVYALTSVGHRYYDRASSAYDPGKGTQLHPELVAAFNAFDKAQAALFDQVYRLNRTVHLDQFAQREKKDGRKLGIISEAAMLEAEDLVRFAATPWDRLDQLDVAALMSRLGALEIVIEELAAYAFGHPDEAEAFDGLQVLLEHAKAYTVSARQLALRARTNTAYSDAEKLMIAAGNEAGVPGTPAAMVQAYNRLVELR